MSKRIGAATFAFAMALFCPSAEQAASAAEVERYTYVADNVVNGGSPTVEELIGRIETPIGHLAPLGHFKVEPAGTTLAFSVDDYANEDGSQVPVYVATQSTVLFQGCAPVRSPVTVALSGAGQPVWFIVGSGDTGKCAGIATAGVVSVSGLD